MQHKFSKSTLSNFCTVCQETAIWALTLMVLPLATTHAQAQTDPPLAPGAKPKPKQAYIRFWNLLPDKQINNLQLLAGDHDTIGGYTPQNYYSGYMSAPVGSYTLVVKRPTEGSPALQRLPVNLPDNGFLTLVATEKNGQVAVEMIDETPDPKVVEATARLVVRQVFPGARVTVTVTGVPASQPLNYGDLIVLSNIPISDQVNINLQAVLPTKTPVTKSVSLTANLSVSHHATLFLAADSYGRFDPRLSIDAIAPKSH